MPSVLLWLTLNLQLWLEGEAIKILSTAGILINLHNNYLNPSFFIIILKKAVRYIEENPWKKREIRDIMSISIGDNYHDDDDDVIKSIRFLSTCYI